MIKKRMIYIICTVLHLSFASEIVYAGLWQTLSSQFSRSVAYAKHRPLVTIAATLSTLALCSGIYWRLKMAPDKVRHRKLLALNAFMRSNYHNGNDRSFYNTLHAQLRDLRNHLTPAQTRALDQLGIDRYALDNHEFWNASARLFTLNQQWIAQG